MDYHHGNGTQEIFYHSDEVLFLSIHANPNEGIPYFSGYADEVGAAAGAGYNRNYPLPLHTTDWSVYRPALEDALNQVVAQKKFWCLVVSFGLDTGRDQCSGQVSDSHRLIFRQWDKLMTGVGLPVLAVQEGGYSEGKALGDVAATFVSGLIAG